jgi:hypothetical protein
VPLPKLPPALQRAIDALKTRRARADAPANDNVWDTPLTGDAWIGVFLIVLSVLSVVVSVQRYYA